MTQQVLNYVGLHAYSIGFDVVSLGLFACAACLIDECYRRGPKKLQEALQKYFGLEEGKDASLSQSVSVVSTSSSTTTDTSSPTGAAMSSSLRR